VARAGGLDTVVAFLEFDRGRPGYLFAGRAARRRSPGQKKAADKTAVGKKAPVRKKAPAKATAGRKPVGQG
jgi:hypothetical protein